MARTGRNHLVLATGLAFGLLSVSSGVPLAAAEPLPCRAATHEGYRYTVCEVDLRRQAVRLFWKKADGEPYRYLGSVPQSLGERRGRLLFATNGGMFHQTTNRSGFTSRTAPSSCARAPSPGSGIST